MKDKAIALAQGVPEIQIVDLDISKKEELSKLVQRADIVVR